MRPRFHLLIAFLLYPGIAHAGGVGFECNSDGALTLTTPAPTDAQGQYILGQGYNSLCPVHDRSQALAWLGKAAEQGHKDAQFALAEMYFSGLGIPVDYPAAKKWYLKAAEQGHGGAQLRLGFLYAEKHFTGLTADLDEAEKWFTKAAEQDVKDARFRLGNFYLNYRTPPQTDKARLWLQRAAEGGHVTAMYDLGRLLMQQNEPAEGIRWITKAADAKDLQAAITLADIYDKGRVVPYDAAAYSTWVLRIADHPAAPLYYLDKAGDMLMDGFAGLPVNYPAARRIFERAAKKNDAYALRRLASIYADGLGIKKDAAKAKKYLDRAAAAELRR